MKHVRGRSLFQSMNEAIQKVGLLEIMNTEQVARGTTFVRKDQLQRSGGHISMNGKGRLFDS